jgi:hypothetical protein
MIPYEKGKGGTVHAGLLAINEHCGDNRNRPEYIIPSELWNVRTKFADLPINKRQRQTLDMLCEAGMFPIYVYLDRITGLPEWFTKKQRGWVHDITYRLAFVIKPPKK